MPASTGPKSAQGKAKSSKNAIKHGLLSVGWIDPTEKAGYEQLLQALMDDHAPQGAAEMLQVERIAINSIKLMRLHRVENAHFAKAVQDVLTPILGPSPAGRELALKQAAAMPPTKLLDTFCRYQTSLERQISKSTGELLAMQNRRKLALANQVSIEPITHASPLI